MPENFKIPDLKYFFMSTFRVDNPSELLIADFQKIVEFSEIGFAMLLKEVINDATNEWRNFVRGELGKGGGGAFFGKFLRQFATNNNFIKRFNYAMSLLLIVCIIGFYI